MNPLINQLENIPNSNVGRQHCKTVANTTVADPYKGEVRGGTAGKRRIFTCSD